MSSCADIKAFQCHKRAYGVLLLPQVVQLTSLLFLSSNCKLPTIADLMLQKFK